MQDLYMAYGKKTERNSFYQLGHPLVAFIMYTLTHHYTLFLVLGYAQIRGCQYILIVMWPVALIQFFIGLYLLSTEIQKANLFITRRPLVAGIKIKHIFFLGFVYAFGYFVPTIVLIQRKGKEPSWLQDFMLKNFAYDLVITCGMSIALLGRKSLKKYYRSLILPIVLCLLSIYFVDHLKLDMRDPLPVFIPNVAGRQAFSQAEPYMYIMSRICYCFVNVASKLFIFKEQALQKAWSQMSDRQHQINLKKETDRWASDQGLNPEIEQVPPVDEMRFGIKTSFMQRKAKELFNFYSFMVKSMHRLSYLRSIGAVQGGENIDVSGWDNANILGNQVRFMHDLEAFLVLNPQSETDLNNLWRTQLIRFKDHVDKPWTRSYLYIKHKLIEYLNKDFDDLETYVHVFKNREIFHTEGEDSSFKVNQIERTKELNQLDVIFDSFLLADFLILGQSHKHTATLISFLDGIAVYPALLVGGRLIGQMNISLLANFKNGFFELWASDVAVIVLIGLSLIAYCLRAISVSNLHYRFYIQWIHDPNKLSFLAILLGAPLTIAIVVYPLLQSLPIITVKVNTGFALVLTLCAYYMMCDLEQRYKTDAILKANLATIFPLPPNPTMSSREKKFAQRYNYEKQRLQITYCEHVCEDIGLHEFLRLAGEVKSIGNLTPMVLTFNPSVDLRERFDDMFHVRSAEWGGFYPCLKTGQVEFVTENYKDVVAQVCKRRIDLLRELEERERRGRAKRHEEPIIVLKQPLPQIPEKEEEEPVITKLIQEVFVSNQEISLPSDMVASAPKAQVEVADFVTQARQTVQTEPQRPNFSIEHIRQQALRADTFQNADNTKQI